MDSAKETIREFFALVMFTAFKGPDDDLSRLDQWEEFEQLWSIGMFPRVFPEDPWKQELVDDIIYVLDSKREESTRNIIQVILTGDLLPSGYGVSLDHLKAHMRNPYLAFKAWNDVIPLDTGMRDVQSRIINAYRATVVQINHYQKIEPIGDMQSFSERDQNYIGEINTLIEHVNLRLETTQPEYASQLSWYNSRARDILVEVIRTEKATRKYALALEEQALWDRQVERQRLIVQKIQAETKIIKKSYDIYIAKLNILRGNPDLIKEQKELLALLDEGKDETELLHFQAVLKAEEQVLHTMIALGGSPCQGRICQQGKKLMQVWSLTDGKTEIKTARVRPIVQTLSTLINVQPKLRSKYPAEEILKFTDTHLFEQVIMDMLTQTSIPKEIEEQPQIKGLTLQALQVLSVPSRERVIAYLLDTPTVTDMDFQISIVWLKQLREETGTWATEWYDCLLDSIQVIWPHMDANKQQVMTTLWRGYTARMFNR